MAEERKSPTEEIINQCIEELEDEKKARRAEAKALKKACDLKECIEDYKTCCLVKSREVWDLYTNLDLCYVAESNKTAMLLNQDIQTHCDKEVALEQKLKDAVKCIKEVKTKLNDVVDEACKIDRCIKEEKRCKRGLHELLKGRNNEWKPMLDRIEELSISCFNISCKAFDAGVDVVGIQTFVDLESLKTLGTELEQKVGALRADVTGNAQSAEAEWKKSLTELVGVKEELVQGEFEKCHAKNAREGIEDTLEFLCDPGGCDKIEDTDLEEICRKVKENFGNGSDDEDDDYEKPKKPSGKNMKQDDEEENWEID